MSKDNEHINTPKEKSKIELLLENISNNTKKLLDTNDSTQNNKSSNTTNTEIKQVSESIKKTNESLKQVSESLQKISDKLSKTPSSNRRTKEQVIIDKAKAELATLKLQETLLKQTRDSVYMQSKIAYMQKEAQKQYEESYKESSVYKTYNTIKTAPSTPVTSIALSAATGGILNPAVIGALHLDKVLNAAVGGMVKSILRPKKKNEYGGSSSAIEKEDPVNKIPRQLDQIIQKLDEKNKDTNTKEEKNKNSIFKTIMQAVKGFIGTVLPAIGMMTLLLPKFANALENRIIETLGIDPENADKTKQWLEDILPFVLIGSKWGIKGALWGAVFGVAKHSVEELANNWENIKENGFNGYTIEKLIDTLGPTGSAISGAVLGYKLGGLYGAAIGAAIGLVGYGAIKGAGLLGEKIADLINGKDRNDPKEQTKQRIESEKTKRNTIKKLIKKEKTTGETDNYLATFRQNEPTLVNELEGIVEKEEQEELIHKNDGFIGRTWSSIKNFFNDDEGLGDYKAAALLSQNTGENLKAYQQEAFNGLNMYTDVPWNWELTNSQSFASTKVIPSDVANNLNAFHNDVITPFQYYLGSNNKLRITSSYRDKKYNTKIGGADNSNHITGNAIDLQCNTMSPKQLVKLLQASGIPFDKAITERNNGKQWLHLEYFPTGTHRGEIADIVGKHYTTMYPGNQGDDISLEYGNNYRLETNNMNSLEAQNNLNYANMNNDYNNSADSNNNYNPYNLNYEHTPYPTTQQAPIIYNIGSSASDSSAYPSGDAARTLLYTY